MIQQSPICWKAENLCLGCWETKCDFRYALDALCILGKRGVIVWRCKDYDPIEPSPRKNLGSDEKTNGEKIQYGYGLD